MVRRYKDTKSNRRKRRRYQAKAISARGKFFTNDGKALEDGHTAYRLDKAKELERKGLIGSIQIMPEFPYYHGREVLWVYRPQFSYWELHPATGARMQKVVVEVLPGHYESRPWVDPMVAAFMATHPDVRVDFRLKDDNTTTQINYVQRRRAGLTTFRSKIDASLRFQKSAQSLPGSGAI
ncbi:hypothetical protein [uncultured Pelagimonas sp.]|uniref:hypothetical protein n=1 Tax=uncultured Pelagimonas sp. TaxID=1618102 RepID=UPI002635954F|nr:hypothetical protein [uncultured Pelagimonas sp.]